MTSRLAPGQKTAHSEERADFRVSLGEFTVR
jgi:hypothetical protein